MMKFLWILTVAVLSSTAVPILPERDNAEEQGDYFEGDMVFPARTRSGIISPARRWPNNQVIYEIDPKFSESEKTVIQAAFKEISTKTCIKFTQHTSETNYVFIRRGDGGGCYSYVGRIGGRQVLNLQGNGCVYVGIAAHELIHTIGYYHEHSRTDRDDYVDINWDNVEQGRESAFKKRSEIEVNPFGVPYDYGSIMHYGAYDFAKDRRVPTIIPKDPNVSIGQRAGLSEYDALKINRMYGCDKNLKGGRL